uniref:Uncharacterized protein n=1 Tax=Sphaerodactylus townsendi TaxID=933632 RepID=A0ACB8FJ50_9SAUR
MVLESHVPNSLCQSSLGFVNSKSGDNQGVKFLRRFKQTLNPAQVFDLMNGDLINRCHLGVLPLGTGNDLARVLGWGGSCDDETQLPQVLEKLERASTKMLDRWSIMSYELKLISKQSILPVTLEEESEECQISAYEDSVAAHLAKILDSDQHSVVISSAKILCETVKGFVAKIGKTCERATENTEADVTAVKCSELNEKLNLLLQALHTEAQAAPVQPPAASSVAEKGGEGSSSEECSSGVSDQSRENSMAAAAAPTLSIFKPREQLMLRANSLKKALRQLIEQAEKAVDEQNAHTEDQVNQMPAEYSKELEESKDEEKEEDTKEMESYSIDFDSNNSCRRYGCTSGCRGWLGLSLPCCGGVIPLGAWQAVAFIDLVELPLSSWLLAWPGEVPQDCGDHVPRQPQAHPQSKSFWIPPPYTVGSGQSMGPSPSADPIMQTTRAKDPQEDLGSPDGQTFNGIYFICISQKWRSAMCDARVYRKTDVGSDHYLVRTEIKLKLRNETPAPTSTSIMADLQQKEYFHHGSKASQDQPSLVDKHQECLRAGLAASIAGSSIISKMLLANIDPFGATPFIDPDQESLEGYSEKCVMNNYFGIGLDAKISLEFNNKREEHPEKCRSRTKNMMWYGVLGTKELLQRTYKNLEQKVQLECDGQYIPLPSLQGIAVLNIPSYAGGINFWGGTKEDDIFGAPSFDDKILEVVAVFGSMQMAVSRVIKLQHHRIAQCRSVKITILGEEGVPVQVDGEAWIQPPGIIKIVHKNRAQMLTRDRAFESTLKSWEDKQKCDSCKPVLRSPLYPQQAVELATEEEASQIQFCSQAAEELITRICEAAKIHTLLEQELAHAVNACSHALNEASLRFPESLTRNIALEIVVSVKALHDETESLLVGRVPLQLESPHEELLSMAVQSLEAELRKLAEIPWLYYVLRLHDDEDPPLEYVKRNRSTVFRIVPKFKKEKARTQKTKPQPVQKWGTDEVAAWLDLLSLGEYKEIFVSHDVRGSELLHLERRDLKAGLVRSPRVVADP